MIPDNTCRIFWKRFAEPKFKDVSPEIALSMRNELIHEGFEVKVNLMKQKRWVTVSQTRGWNCDQR